MTWVNPIPKDFDWRNPDYAPVWAERVSRLERLRADPSLVDPLKAFYKDNPVAFIMDWGCTFDPRNAERDLPTTVPFLLFPKQAEFVDFVVNNWRSRQDWLVEKSRDMGVSWLCVGLAVWWLLFYPGMVIGFGSRKEEYVDDLSDPKSLFWKVRAFISLLPAEFRPAGWDEKKHAPFMTIRNPENGAVIFGEAGDNIGRGARAGVYFKDESAFYERPEKIDAALSQTANCKGDISTPNGEGNPFWKKRHGGRFPVFVFDWRDDPRKGPEWYRKQVHDLDSIVLAQEVDRDYSASIANSFIKGDTVTQAASRGPADVPAMGPLRVGLDVARFGDDKCSLTFRRGRVLIKQTTWGKTDIMSTAGRAKQEINAYRGATGVHLEQIAVDVIGLGAGVADALRAWFGDDVVVDVNSSLRMDDGENYNLNAFMWTEMSTWLETASIPNDPELRTDLTGRRYFYRGGLRLLESKDDMKKRGLKSPDRGDSLALTFAIPGGSKPKKRLHPSQVPQYEPDTYTGF